MDFVAYLIFLLVFPRVARVKLTQQKAEDLSQSLGDQRCVITH